MSVKNVPMALNLLASSKRGPSDVIWKDCPVLDFIEDPGKGMCFFDDFLVAGSGPSATGGAIAQANGQWSTYLYQGATVTDAALEGGVISFGSDGDNEGVAFGSGAGAFRITTTSTLVGNGKLWFEARIAKASIAATKADCVVGLFDSFLSSGLPQAGYPISTTDNTLGATMNFLGFHLKGNGPTEVNFAYQLSGTATVYPTGMTTLMNTCTSAVLAAAQYIKLGFLFDPKALPKTISTASTGQTVGQLYAPLIRVFVNGQEAPAFLTSTNVYGTSFPTGFMSPGFAIMNQTGSSPTTMQMDWIRCAQIANS